MVSRRCSVLLLIGMLVPLAACGGADPPTTPSSLRVVRYDNIAIKGVAPFDRTVTNALVATLYSRIPSLPPEPKGDVSCLLDRDFTYTLTFSRGSQVLMQATAYPVGCDFITWDSQGRIMTDAFWSEVAKTLGVPKSQLIVIPIDRIRAP